MAAREPDARPSRPPTRPNSRRPGGAFTRHAYAPDALLIEPPTDVHSLPGFAEGLASVQDAAAQLAVDLLGPQPGERVLDACAAPGGKTCHLLERVGGRADVTALDVSEARLGRVRENLGRLGLEARVMAGDVTQPRAWWDGRPFDRILLDVPCSATGVIRRHPDIKVLRRARDIPALAHRQADMLAAAWGLLRPGGTLLYTSCSVLQAEDEGVIEGFLARTADATDLTPGRTARLAGPPRGRARGTWCNPGKPTWTASIMLASARPPDRW